MIYDVKVEDKVVCGYHLKRWFFFLPLRLKDTKQHKEKILANLGVYYHLCICGKTLFQHKEKIIKKDDIPFPMIPFFCTFVAWTIVKWQNHL